MSAFCCKCLFHTPRQKGKKNCNKTGGNLLRFSVTFDASLRKHFAYLSFDSL